MAANLAEEIKSVEALSREMVKEAKGEAVKIINESRDTAEERIKETRQKSFRQFKEKLSSVEKEAEQKAAGTLGEGLKNSEILAGKYEKKVQSTAKWISEEVISRYGRGWNKKS